MTEQASTVTLPTVALVTKESSGFRETSFASAATTSNAWQASYSISSQDGSNATSMVSEAVITPQISAGNTSAPTSISSTAVSASLQIPGTDGNTAFESIISSDESSIVVETELVSFSSAEVVHPTSSYLTVLKMQSVGGETVSGLTSIGEALPTATTITPSVTEAVLSPTISATIVSETLTIALPTVSSINENFVSLETGIEPSSSALKDKPTSSFGVTKSAMHLFTASQIGLESTFAIDPSSSGRSFVSETEPSPLIPGVSVGGVTDSGLEMSTTVLKTPLPSVPSSQWMPGSSESGESSTTQSTSLVSSILIDVSSNFNEAITARETLSIGSSLEHPTKTGRSLMPMVTEGSISQLLSAGSTVLESSVPASVESKVVAESLHTSLHLTETATISPTTSSSDIPTAFSSSKFCLL